jgi:hypothetical protein
MWLAVVVTVVTGVDYVLRALRLRREAAGSGAAGSGAAGPAPTAGPAPAAGPAVTGADAPPTVTRTELAE